MKIQKIILMFLAFVVPLFALASGARVLVTPIKYGEFNLNNSYLGQVVFKQSSNVAAEVEGIVKNVYVEIGQKVEKDQNLIELDSTILKEQINAKEAQLKEAKSLMTKKQRELKRYESLLESKSIALQQYENLSYDLEAQNNSIIALEAELKLLDLKLQKTIIKAPINGVIIDDLVKVGEWVNKGKSVIYILNTKMQEVIVYLPLQAIDKIKKDEILDIKIQNKILKAKVSAIIPKSNSLSHTFPVRLKIQNSDIKLFEGEAASVYIASRENTKGYIIPRDSIISKEGVDKIFVIEEGQNKAKEIDIQILSFAKKEALIESTKLNKKLKVIYRGQNKLKNDQLVVPVK